MKCHICDVDKLSKEFPRENVAKECNHPPIHCFRCVIEKLGTPNDDKMNVCCPYTGCDVIVVDPKKIVTNCKTELELLYPPIYPSSDVEQLLQVDLSNTPKVVNVVMLTGDSATFRYTVNMKVQELKELIKKELNIPPEKQQLIYNEQVLEEYTQNGQMAKLVDYNVQAFGTIQLMVLLYAIPSHFNHVIFDLFWGYPAHGCDYLDASCLLFSNKECMSVVDYSKRCVSATAVRHSGDVMDHAKRLGHHTIEVHLKDLPSNVTHLYFTLSAWNSPTIAHFPNPSLNFFEAANKSKNLCETTFTHARNSQAVIMCSVKRQGNQWNIFECGTLSAGNAKNYNPLIAKIRQLIAQ